MVGVDGSSPFAPTKFGRGIKHLAETLGAFFLAVRKKYGKAGVVASAQTPVTWRFDGVTDVVGEVHVLLQAPDNAIGLGERRLALENQAPIVRPAKEVPQSVEIRALEHEVFCVLFLDAQHRIIALKQMFRGTVTQTSVYPREVVKEALGLNAAAVLFAHNHSSGSVEPSGPTSS